MKEKEKQLFINLCKPNSHTFDKSLLSFASPNVLGHLFFNRMQATAYGTLRRFELLNNVNREFRNSLKNAYEHNLTINHSFALCLQQLNVILAPCTCKYAMLKGAYLYGYYPQGYRSCNDIDLLVSPEHITEIGSALSNAGFDQGYLKNGRFTPATRSEIIQSRMMRGETVPYIKETGLKGMQYLEVDINFSLDCKPGDRQIVDNMLKNVSIRSGGGIAIQTLSEPDFFLHLCSHLYKEATTFPWIEMKRDMTLYKYCDLYMLLSEMSNAQLDLVFTRAEFLNIDKICAFAILKNTELFDMENTYAKAKAESVLKDEPDFMHLVSSPKDKAWLIYTERDLTSRFFSDDRTKLLKRYK